MWRVLLASEIPRGVDHADDALRPHGIPDAIWGPVIGKTLINQRF